MGILLNSAILGHDGTWVAHPGLVPIAKQVFNECMPKPNQIDKQVFQVFFLQFAEIQILAKHQHH